MSFVVSMGMMVVMMMMMMSMSFSVAVAMAVAMAMVAMMAFAMVIMVSMMRMASALGIIDFAGYRDFQLLQRCFRYFRHATLAETHMSMLIVQELTVGNIYF